MPEESTKQMTIPSSLCAQGMLCAPNCNWLFIYDPKQDAVFGGAARSGMGFMRRLIHAAELQRPDG